jgi:hypothetical protein
MTYSEMHSLSGTVNISVELLTSRSVNARLEIETRMKVTCHHVSHDYYYRLRNFLLGIYEV